MNGAEPVASVEAYVAAVSGPLRTLLDEVLATIWAAAPGADLVLSYGMPTFKVDGRAVVGVGAFKAHLSLFPMGSAALGDLEPEIAPFRTGKGTLQFTPTRPLPPALITQIVASRIAANAAQAAARQKNRRTR